MDDLKSRFLNPENFYLAFKRLKYYYSQSNEWYDPLELSSYEANLSTNISQLIKEIEEESYSPHPIEPLPFPKRNHSDGTEKIRQYFKIHITDQIVWIAITNIIGRFLEEKMPFWSYGNRLFRPIWFENNEIQKGNFSNSSQHLYRKWNQSWPFYRRHISMTVKTMALNKKFTKDKLLDEKEIEIFNQEESNNWNEYLYFDKNFWQNKVSKKLYWIGLDYKKFFPSVDAKKITYNIKKYLVDQDGNSRSDRRLLLDTIEKMLKFPIKSTGFNKDELKNPNKFSLKDAKSFYGIPTGLLVSGFLANIAMMEVDDAITKYLKKFRNIAIFKYVDDQVILSSSQKGLKDFLRFYHETLNASGTNVEFQEEKIIPKGAYEYSISSGFKLNNLNNENELDVEFPQPLMTYTLQKMSHLNHEDYDLKDNEELEESAADMEHFLLADFPDEEMRKDTRMAFAAMKLCQIANKIRPNFKKIDKSLPYLKEMANAYKKESKVNKRGLTPEKIIDKIIAKGLKEEIRIVNVKHKKIFRLLLKATKENPDKLKLWKRSVEFCYETGINEVKTVLQEIENVKLNDKSKEYLRCYCALIISELLLKGYNALHSEYRNFWRSYRIIEFVSSVLKNRLFDEELFKLPFAKKAFQNYELVYDFISKQKFPEIKYISTPKLPNNKKLDSVEDKSFYLSTDNNFEDNFWFLLSNIRSKQRIKLWRNNVQALDFSNLISWSIISLYPNNITKVIFDKMKLDFDKNKEDSYSEKADYMNKSGGFLFEIFESNKEIRNKWLHKYPKIEAIRNSEDSNYISLNNWLKQILKISHNDNWIEPRLSEWSMLEIIKQISLAIKNDINNDKYDVLFLTIRESYKVHPSNYLIPKTWLNIEKNKITWDIWKKKTEEKTIKMVDAESLIDDFRYLPLVKFWKTTHYGNFFSSGEFTVIVQLSVLLIQLLSKSFEWPPMVNKIAFIDQLFSKALKVIENEPVSSDTRLLLSAIFSKKDADFFMSSNFFELDDGTYIKNLTDFVSQINKIQLALKPGQLTLINHAPRQLTFIDLDKLNKAKKIF